MMTKKRVVFIVIPLIGFLNLVYFLSSPASTNIKGSTTPPQHAHEERKRMDPVTSNSVQELRRMTIKTACERIEGGKHVFNEAFVNPTNMYSETYKFLVCEIPKCGSTSWLKALLIMEGHYTVEDYFIEGKFQGEGPKIFHIGWVEMNLWHMKNKIEQLKTWKKAFKVIMVRHPFDRMVSAYVNRLKYGAPGFGASFKTLSYELNAKYRHLRHNTEDRNKTDHGAATFEDFVNYLVDSDGGKDPHFSFYHTRCSVCTVHYDYIIKFETMREDIEYLQNYLNISQQHRRVLFPEAKQLTQPVMVKEYFQQISKELMLKVYNVYKKDFVLFGYDRPV